MEVLSLPAASLCLLFAGDLLGGVFWEITADNGQSRALAVTSSIGQDCGNPLLCWKICFAVVGALWSRHLLQIQLTQERGGAGTRGCQGTQPSMVPGWNNVVKDSGKCFKNDFC